MLDAKRLDPSYSLILPFIIGLFAILWSRRHERKKVGFADLPGEILSEVFMHLDWEGLCSVKQTCRACYFTTKSRQLWSDLVRGLQESSFRRPEERLDEYSTDELEAWVMLRLRSRALWKASAPPIVRPRSFDGSVGRGTIEYQPIVPGGRWLLTIGSGMACVVDLDAYQLEPRLLFNPGQFTETGGPDEVTRCSYWIDDSKPRLSFRVGVCNDLLSSVIPSRGWTFLRILVYQVDLEGHGSNANLVAEPVVCIRSHGTGIRSICLNADYVVEFLCRVERQGGTKITSHFLRLYHYTAGEIEEQEIKPFTLVIENFVRHMDFIPNNRITAFNSAALQIFGISPSENEVHHSINMLYTIPMACPFTFSPLFRSPHSTSKMVIFGNDEVKGIEIPDHDPTTTVIRKIGDHQYHWNTGARAAAGFSTGVVVHKNGTMDFLSYSWGQGSDVTFGRTSCSSGPIDFSDVVVTSDLGRIVVTRRGRCATILDLYQEQTAS